MQYRFSISFFFVINLNIMMTLRQMEAMLTAQQQAIKYLSKTVETLRQKLGESTANTEQEWLEEEAKNNEQKNELLASSAQVDKIPDDADPEYYQLRKERDEYIKLMKKCNNIDDKEYYRQMIISVQRQMDNI